MSVNMLEMKAETLESAENSISHNYNTANVCIVGHKAEVAEWR